MTTRGLKRKAPAQKTEAQEELECAVVAHVALRGLNKDVWVDMRKEVLDWMV